MRSGTVVTILKWLGVLASVVLVVLVALTRNAHADSPTPPTATVDLYTIGPSPEFPSRFGHSLLCIREAGKDSVEDGTCYDYGVPDREDMGHIVWTAVRETPAFIPVTIPEQTAVKFFRKQGRAIEKQRLPLQPAEVAKLSAALELEVRERRAYAYHPYWQNCATKIRDHLDAATEGRLHKGPTVYPKTFFREYMEEGHGGNADILTVMALYLGEGNDKVPSGWEAMLLPMVLRDGVAERLSAPIEKVDDSVEPFVPGSGAVGRITVFGLGVLLVLAVRVAAWRGRLRLGLKIVGGFLGVFAVTIELVAALVKWTEISHNWSLFLFVPTDLLLPYLEGRRLTLYLKVRLTMAAIVAILEVANVIHQPMLPLVALVALPMLGTLSALRDRAARPPRSDEESSVRPSASIAG